MGNVEAFAVELFGNSAKFGLGLQDDFDIEHELNEKQDQFNSIKQLNVA